LNAEQTARQVLAWAAQPSGPLPVGSLNETGRLIEPMASTLTLLGDLTLSTAAMLGADTSAFGDENPVGAGAVLLAAAVGGRRQPGPARQLALALPPTRPQRMQPQRACWRDLIARHGVVAPALPALEAPAVPAAAQASSGTDAEVAVDEPLAETLLRMSLLTAVLYRPPAARMAADTTADEVEVAAALTERPRGPEVLAAAMSRWAIEPAVLNWRMNLLDRLGVSHPALLLDTYTLARLRHGADWDLRVRWARRRLSALGPPDQLALATARFWVPLARLAQRGMNLRQKRPLLTGHEAAVDLVHRHRLLTAGAA
jgi:hypothetical protein